MGKDIRFRKPETVARYEKKLADDIDFINSFSTSSMSNGLN